MEEQLGRNYITNNYQHYHRQMLGKRLKLQNNSRNRNQLLLDTIEDNQDSNNNNNANNNNANNNNANNNNANNNANNNNANNNANNNEFLLESPNPFMDENHPDFDKGGFENYSFNLNQLSINNHTQPIPNDNQENNKNEIIDLIQSWNDRLSWDNYFICIAFLIASRSSCNRLNVGCVLVKNTRIISVGYNGFLPKMPHESIVRNNHEQATVHAEQNAVSDCARRGIKMDGATAYITHYPCLNCFKILAASGISTIKYHNDYKNDSVVDLLSKGSGINILKI